jgi:hypothetical protein
VCCERALKSVGERNTHNQQSDRYGGLRETACTLHGHGGLWELAHLTSSGDLAAVFFFPAGKLLTALLGERLRRSQLAALTPS